MQSSPSSWRSALRAAFPHTVPILAGFLVLGVTYGMLMQAIGYGPLWSGLFSAIAFGGSTQYAAVPLLAAGFDPLEVFLLSLTISARHLFYSVSMLKKYDDLGWKRWALYYTLCDETFSVVSTVEPPEGVDAGKFYLFVSLLDWNYWVTASMLGGVLGGVLPFDISGMDFALTALFVVLFLEQLRQKAAQSGAQEDAQAYNDFANLCTRFEKKLHDLELTRMISVQMGPQTRLLQNNDTLMVEKIQSSLVNTIPLWKSQMVLALGLEHGRQATAAQSAVTEMTNELLKKNADLLKMGTIETAKEAERSVVDIETLQHTNQQLISTLDEVLNIQREGAQKRRAAEAELGRIEGELKQKLLELRN